MCVCKFMERNTFPRARTLTSRLKTNGDFILGQFTTFSACKDGHIEEHVPLYYIKCKS